MRKYRVKKEDGVDNYSIVETLDDGTEKTVNPAALVAALEVADARVEFQQKQAERLAAYLQAKAK